MRTTDLTPDPDALPPDCEAFGLVLPDYLERSLDADALAIAESHRVRCDRCASLVRDLDAIRAGAAVLPAVVPSRDLWPGIADRIAAPVVALAPAATRPARARWAVSFRLAAALVLGSVGVTWLATRRSTVPATVASSPATPSDQRLASRPEGSPASGAAATAAAAATVPVVVPARATGVAGRPSTGAATVVPVGRKPSAERTYDQEITGLREVLRERQSALDPKTVAVIQRNLTVIDSAIAESRRALAADPHSAFLGDQLDRALDTKLELLRTAALLPTRT
jgi:hypothetical protein